MSVNSCGSYPRASARYRREPALAAGYSLEEARRRAAGLLSRLNLPERLWTLPPATFPVANTAAREHRRGFAGRHGILILDEPTASLDAANREAFVALMVERKAEGSAFVGIFHDEDVRSRLADRIIDVSAFAAKEAA